MIGSGSLGEGNPETPSPTTVQTISGEVHPGCVRLVKQNTEAVCLCREETWLANRAIADPFDHLVHTLIMLRKLVGQFVQRSMEKRSAPRPSLPRPTCGR